jgi:lysophospholipase L1-like esterase
MLAGVADEVSSGAPRTRPDVLVLMAGNNDLDDGVPYVDIARNLVSIAELVQARRVVLSTVAPEDEVGEDVAALNAQLAGLAQQHGWQLVDPMGGVGDGAGHYLPGMTDDGVHPTEDGARLIGAAMHPALVG